MRSIILWPVVVLLFTRAADVASAPLDNGLTVPVGVLQPQDIGIQRLYRGRSLPQTWTVYTLYWAQLEIYRRTVHRRGDGILESLNIETEHQSNLRLEIRPYEFGDQSNSMTLGSSFYGISSMLQTMLVPARPGDGFWELKWRIFQKAVRPSADVPLGYLNLVLGRDGTDRNITSHDLQAPFPVPETDITLLIGPPGPELVQGDVIFVMLDLMSTAWQNLARNHVVRPLSGRTWTGLSRARVSVTLRPRMNGGTSMVTDTDLAEAAYGIATYFVTEQPAFATKITVVRPDESGRRVPVGELEIVSRSVRVEVAGLGNGSAVET